MVTGLCSLQEEALGQVIAPRGKEDSDVVC